MIDDTILGYVNLYNLKKKFGKCARHRFMTLDIELKVCNNSIVLSANCPVGDCPASKSIESKIPQYSTMDPATAMYYTIKGLIKKYNESEFKRVFI